MSEENLSSLTYSVAIIGGGFTGTTLAAQLLRNDPEISVVVIERFGLPGRGVAYGTQYCAHYLNVEAGSMSAFPDDPGHFLRWAKANYDYGTEARDFLPRRIYGQYIASLIAEADHRLEWRQDEALSITPVEKRVEVRLRSGPKVVADKVVLGVGNFRPSDPLLPGKSGYSKRYISFAWSATAFEGVEQEASILLVGSGLTSVDVALALRAHEFRGRIHILSRRGVIPEWHQIPQSWPTFWNENSPRNVRGLLKLIRHQVVLARKQGIDWRAVIDSLRPVTAQIWQSLPAAEKRRFLRHLRPYWDAHRHRVCARIGGVMLYQVLKDDLQIHTGRVVRYQEDQDGIEVTYRDRRSGEEEQLFVDRIINCTGPETDCRELNDPLVRNLIEEGLARPDPLFLGLDVAEEGALIGSDGKPSSILYTAGPPRKGRLWETTAVPEIRVQVAELARRLLSETNRGRASAQEQDVQSGAASALSLGGSNTRENRICQQMS